MKIPFVDIFAGPGGLGEGFSRHSSFTGNPIQFKGVLSIEKDPVAARTLTLRNWVHQFEPENLPENYYIAVRNSGSFEALHSTKEWPIAKNIVWNAELGKICDQELHSRIKKAIGKAKNWILLGGPPCQAYSLAGRSRMTGVGQNVFEDDADEISREKKENFYADHRHVLYREYLRIVAIHQPKVFVMENVKGILSSKISRANGQPERIFPRIRKDLTNPARALKEDKVYQSLESFHPVTNKSYDLFSFVEKTDLYRPKDRDFIIRCEDYGVPQSRHRVIILGIRSDITAVCDTLSVLPTVNLRDVLENLPALRSGLSRGGDSPAAWQAAINDSISGDTKRHLERNHLKTRLEKILSRKRISYTRGQPYYTFETEHPSKHEHTVLKWIDAPRLGGVLQHETRGHMASDLGRYLFASLMTEKRGATPKLQQWPVNLLPKHKNITTKKGSISVSGFHDRFRVQVWDKPSTTITSHISKDGHYYIHPDPAQCRSLTVREAARLQTFSDNYFFCGNRTQQYHQVGNAVPPFLAVQLASIVAGIFEKVG